MKKQPVLPRRNWLGAGLSLLVVIAAATGIAWEVADLLAYYGPTPASSPAPATPPPIDEAPARAHAWSRSEPLLADAERQAAVALDKQLGTIAAFLAERKPGTRAFAERMLSLRGKWELVKAQVATDSDQEYARFLDESFAELVFRADDLRQVVETAIRGYLAELEGIEANLLVRLRADLSEDELPLQAVIPALRSDEALSRHYCELAGRLTRDLHTDLAFVAGRELVVWEATTVATELTMKAGAAVAARLGVSAGIIAVGAASTWTTLGVGLVVAIVVDAVINQIIKAAGYDAEERVAERVGQTLDDLGRTITEGDAEVRASLARLKAMQTDDPDAEVRAACQQAIARIEAGSQIYGLRAELSKIAAARASLRKEALRRLIHDTEVTP